jgi:sulfate transport system substrate-binding protein
VILRRLASRFPAIKTFSVEQALGSWSEVQTKHFADGAVYDQIIVKR